MILYNKVNKAEEEVEGSLNCRSVFTYKSKNAKKVDLVVITIRHDQHGVDEFNYGVHIMEGIHGLLGP